MSPALTNNEYGVMIGKKKKKKVLKNESEPQEARRCKGWENSIIL